MRNYYIYLLLACLLSITSCTKVDNLSDEASIVSFRITNISEGIEIDENNITITKDNKGSNVSIPLLFGRKNFPLKLSADIRFSSTTDDMISVDENPLNLKEFIFNDVYTFHTFYMISESGQPHLATIRIIAKCGNPLFCTQFTQRQLFRNDTRQQYLNYVEADIFLAFGHHSYHYENGDSQLYEL